MPKKHLFLVQKIGYGYGGYPPSPFTDKIPKVVFDVFPWGAIASSRFNLFISYDFILFLNKFPPTGEPSAGTTTDPGMFHHKKYKFTNVEWIEFLESWFVSSEGSSYSDDGLLYISTAQRPLFQIFTQSLDAFDVSSVTLSCLNNINANDVTRC